MRWASRPRQTEKLAFRAARKFSRLRCHKRPCIGQLFRLFGYGSILMLALALMGCSGICLNRPAEWLVEANTHGRPTDRSSRLFLPATDPCHGIELEIVSTFDGQRMFVNLVSFHLKEGVSYEIGVELEDHMRTYTANLFEGGQRLLLPCDAAQEIINCLLDGQYVCLHLGCRKREISSEGFLEKFTRLADPPSNDWGMDNAYRVLGLR